MSKLIYLDNSATSFPKPDVVYDFMNDFYRKHGVNPGRSGFDAAVETEEVVNSTRKMLTKLFNGGNDHNRLTFSYNATDSLNLIINGLVEKGMHVVSTMLEHNSVLLTNHGQVVCGKDFNQVYERATFFEMACRIIVQSGGDYSVLTPAEIEDLEIYVLGKKTK